MAVAAAAADLEAAVGTVGDAAAAADAAAEAMPIPIVRSRAG